MPENEEGKKMKMAITISFFVVLMIPDMVYAGYSRRDSEGALWFFLILAFICMSIYFIYKAASENERKKQIKNLKLNWHTKNLK